MVQANFDREFVESCDLCAARVQANVDDFTVVNGDEVDCVACFEWGRGLLRFGGHFDSQVRGWCAVVMGDDQPGFIIYIVTFILGWTLSGSIEYSHLALSHLTLDSMKIVERGIRRAAVQTADVAKSHDQRYLEALKYSNHKLSDTDVDNLVDKIIMDM